MHFCVQTFLDCMYTTYVHSTYKDGCERREARDLVFSLEEVLIKHNAFITNFQRWWISLMTLSYLGQLSFVKTSSGLLDRPRRKRNTFLLCTERAGHDKNCHLYREGSVWSETSLNSAELMRSICKVVNLTGQFWQMARAPGLLDLH